MNDINEIKLCTSVIAKCEYKRYQNYVVTPDKIDWDFNLLSILINEMRKWKLDPTNGFRTRKKSNGAKYYFFRYISINNTDSYIIIDISDKRIVKFSKTIVDEWPDEDVNMFHIRKYFIWKIDSKGSRAIMRNAPLLFYPEKDFSKIFYTFARSFVEHKIAPQQDDTVSIYDFYNNFVKVSVFDPIDFENK